MKPTAKKTGKKLGATKLEKKTTLKMPVVVPR
jgi:hypothetical protein